MRECPKCGGSMIKDAQIPDAYYCGKCGYETRKGL